jgi:LPS export ABC transporter protein LptC
MRGRGIARIARRLGLVALACALAGCSSALEQLGPTRPGRTELPPAQLEGVLFEGYRGELRDLYVTSQSASVDMVARVAQLSGVRMALAEPTRGPIEVSAPTGELQLDDDDFVLSGGVEGTAAKGERFTTDRLEYVAAKRRLVSRDPVTLKRDSFELRADGLEIDLATRTLRLVGKVQAKVKPS